MAPTTFLAGPSRDEKMVYFILNRTTSEIKIGYSKDPKRRLTTLQTSTPHELVLLGTVQGGLEYESAYHDKFEKSRLQGEWFRGDILPDVRAILAREAKNPPQKRTNVIVSGDYYFNDLALVHKALDEIHAKTPVAWVITGGDRNFDFAAWRWAETNKVQLHRYWPKWRAHGKFAGFKVGPQMLRSMFDPKLLLVFLADEVSRSTSDLIRRAEKAGIEVVKKKQEEGQPAVTG